MEDDMPTKAELLKQAKKAGVDVPSNATKADIEAALADNGGPSIHDPTLTQEQLPAGDDGSGPEPHEINSALSSDRMRAVLKDHREMGSRP
jgi:hypothetical protein